MFEASNICATFFRQRTSNYIIPKSDCKMLDYVVLSYGVCGFANGATNIKHKCERQFVCFYDIINCCFFIVGGDYKPVRSYKCLY